MRVLSRLSCVEGFNTDEYLKCGIIVSYAPDTKNVRRINQKRELDKSSLSRFERQMRTFFKDKACFELDNLFVRLGNLPLRQDLKFDKLPVFHVNVNEKADSVRFDMDDILDKIH